MSQYISGQLESVATAGSPDSVFSKKTCPSFSHKNEKLFKKLPEIKVNRSDGRHLKCI